MGEQCLSPFIISPCSMYVTDLFSLYYDCCVSLVSVTDFLWLNENVLISCSKDGKLVQQLMTEAQRPSEKAVSYE